MTTVSADSTDGIQNRLTNGYRLQQMGRCNAEASAISNAPHILRIFKIFHQIKEFCKMSVHLLQINAEIKFFRDRVSLHHTFYQCPFRQFSELSILFYHLIHMDPDPQI